MVFLHVNGVSQLEKEIKELVNLQNTTIDFTAIQRNETTGEIEPAFTVNEIIARDGVQVKRSLKRRRNTGQSATVKVNSGGALLKIDS